MKRCRLCSVGKAPEAFYARHGECKECTRERERRRYFENRDRRCETRRAWYVANAESERKSGVERAAQWAKANPDRKREIARRSMRRRRASTPEQVNAERRRDYALNKARRLEMNKAWRQRNTERVMAHSLMGKHRRRSRLADVVVEHVDRLKVFERDGWVCGICQEPIDRASKAPHPLSPSVDHIIPIAKGGNHTYENCQTAHLACNISKGARMQESAA